MNDDTCQKVSWGNCLAPAALDGWRPTTGATSATSIPDTGSGLNGDETSGLDGDETKATIVLVTRETASIVAL